MTFVQHDKMPCQRYDDSFHSRSDVIEETMKGIGKQKHSRGGASGSFYADVKRNRDLLERRALLVYI